MSNARDEIMCRYHGHLVCTVGFYNRSVGDLHIMMIRHTCTLLQITYIDIHRETCTKNMYGYVYVLYMYCYKE